MQTSDPIWEDIENEWTDIASGTFPQTATDDASAKPKAPRRRRSTGTAKRKKPSAS